MMTHDDTDEPNHRKHHSSLGKCGVMKYSSKHKFDPH